MFGNESFRSRTALHVALAVLCSISLPLRGAPSAEQSVAEGDHFRIVCEFTDEKGAAKALQAAEAVWPSIVLLWGAPVGPLEKRLVVHVYPDAQSYETAEQGLTGGRFKKNLSFSSYVTGESYVAVQPELTPAARAEIGLPLTTLRVVAHEAAHIATYRLVPNHESHPDWLAEGYATWSEQKAIESLGWSKSAEEEPYVSTATVRCQRLIANKRFPTAAVLVANAPSELDFYDGYAVDRLFFRFLQEKRADLAKRALARIVQLGGGADFAARSAAELDTIFGKGLTQLDKDFRAFVGDLHPVWDEVLRTLETEGDSWTQAAFEQNAIAWHTKPVGKLPFELRGFAKVLEGAPQMNVLLDRSDAGFLSVALRAEDGGSITLFEFDSKSEAWNKLGSVPAAGIEIGKEFVFHVSISKSKKLLVEVGEAKAAIQVSADVSKRECTGPWGLGVQAHGAGIWRSVREGR